MSDPSTSTNESLRHDAAVERRTVAFWKPLVLTYGIAGIALVLAVLGFARKEPLRAAFGALVLGGATLALEFAGWAFGAVALAILVVFVLSQLGIG